MTAEENFKVIRFDSVDSTNVRISADRAGLSDRTVYAARLQTAGRGQRGNSWTSAQGENLTFSILLKPTYLPAAGQFAISEAVALGLTDYLSSRGMDARIKWPNDIYVADRKICGILIENFIGGANLADCIAGIGLNVNQKDFGPSAPNPTSIFLEKGVRYDVDIELISVLTAVDKRLKTLEDGCTDELERDYLSRLYRMGEWHEYIDCRDNADTLTPTTIMIEGKRFTGCITGVAPGGFLRVETADGEEIQFAFKEIRYVI